MGLHRVAKGIAAVLDQIEIKYAQDCVEVIMLFDKHNNNAFEEAHRSNIAGRRILPPIPYHETDVPFMACSIQVILAGRSRYILLK